MSEEFSQFLDWFGAMIGIRNLLWEEVFGDQFINYHATTNVGIGNPFGFWVVPDSVSNSYTVTLWIKEGDIFHNMQIGYTKEYKLYDRMVMLTLITNEVLRMAQT